MGRFRLVGGVMAAVALAGGAAAQAATTENIQEPFSATVFIPCANGGAGENVDLSGGFHALETLTINGNNHSMDTHFNPENVSGIGESTGDKYNATGVTLTHSTGSFVNGQSTQTFVDRFDIIGQGPGNNDTVHDTAHTTVNSNGTITVFFDHFSADCN